MTCVGCRLNRPGLPRCTSLARSDGVTCTSHQAQESLVSRRGIRDFRDTYARGSRRQRDELGNAAYVMMRNRISSLRRQAAQGSDIDNPETEEMIQDLNASAAEDY